MTLALKLPVFTGATSLTNGKIGLVPAPLAGDEDLFLAGDGTFKAAGSSYSVFTGATAGTNGTTGLVPQPLAGQENYVLHGDSTWKASSGDTTIHGNVQQVQTVTLQSRFSQTCVVSGEFQDITGLTVNITPSRANSKLLIGGWVTTTGGGGGIRVIAGGQVMAKGSASSSSADVATVIGSGSGSTGVQTIPFYCVVDNVGGTQQLTVKVQRQMGTATTVAYFNGTGTDTDSVNYVRSTSHLWVMEILQNSNPNVASKAAEIFSAYDNTYQAAATTAFIMSGRLLKNAVNVVPTNSTSYNLFLGQINNNYSVSGIQHNIFKNGTQLYTATSAGSRISVLNRCENTIAGAISIVGIENIVASTPSFYQVYSGFNGTVYHTYSAASPAFNTGNEAQSYLHCLNFNTSGSSNWKGISTTTLATTDSSSTASGAAYTTGLSASVTPASASEYLLVLVNVNFNKNAAASANTGITISRDGTPLTGNAAGSRVLTTAAAITIGSATAIDNMTLAYLVAAGSTSATTFTVQLNNADNTTQTIYVNRSQTDTDNTNFARAVSQISVIRILPNA